MSIFTRSANMQIPLIIQKANIWKAYLQHAIEQLMSVQIMHKCKSVGAKAESEGDKTTLTCSRRKSTRTTRCRRRLRVFAQHICTPSGGGPSPRVPSPD